MRAHQQSAGRLYVASLLGLSLVSTGFYIVGALNGNSRDWYLVWNLFLAWIPFALSVWLARFLARDSWSAWPAIGLSLAWLLFLPNSFYIVSDLIHLHDMPHDFLLFDTLMFSLFTITGLLLGFASLYLVHEQLRRRLPRRETAVIINLIIAVCSFAIYLGRDLRWNSWDVLLSPAGILFDISERLLHPLAHPLVFSVTAMFFVFLSSLYWAAWLIRRASVNRPL